jgi:hypothetical protein
LIVHVPVEFRQRDGNADFWEIEDGVQPGECFPVEARADAAMQCEEGRFGFRENVGFQGGNMVSGFFLLARLLIKKFLVMIREMVNMPPS